MVRIHWLPGTGYKLTIFIKTELKIQYELKSGCF
jgi:hypothetical protein